MPSRKVGVEGDGGMFDQAGVDEALLRGGASNGSTPIQGVMRAELGLTREAFVDMQSDRDLSPSLAGGEEDGYVPLGRPGKAYFTMCPDPAYELTCVVTFDPRKSDTRNDPFVVLRPMWSKFPPSLLRVKRLLLCQSFQDEAQRCFIWVADWHETNESPTELHKSVARVVARARHGWGQALYERGLYRWRQWPESMGEEPIAVWPEQDFYSILQVTLQDRVIATADHELIACVGEEHP